MSYIDMLPEWMGGGGGGEEINTQSHSFFDPAIADGFSILTMVA